MVSLSTEIMLFASFFFAKYVNLKFKFELKKKLKMVEILSVKMLNSLSFYFLDYLLKQITVNISCPTVGTTIAISFSAVGHLHQMVRRSAEKNGTSQGHNLREESRVVEQL